MAALGDDPAVLEDDDPVGALHRGEAVGNDERGAALGQPFDGLLHRALALGVERTGGLVEQEDGGVAQDGAGDGEALRWPPESMTPRSPT